MKPRRLLVTLGVVAGWGLAVVLGAQGLQRGFAFWRQIQGELSQAKEQLRRMQGWLEVEKEVASRWKAALGPLSQADSSDWGWVALQGLQELANAQGLRLDEIRPTQVPVKKGQAPVFRWDAKLEGTLEQVSALLTRLTDAIPGIRLESFQLLPKEGQTVQALIRLDLKVQ